jgi:LacI family transcriptional regulator
VFGHNLAFTMTMEKVQVISSELHRLGYKMFLAGGEESDIALEREIVEDLLARRVEGLIINVEPDADPAYYEELQQRGVPLVLLGLLRQPRPLPIVSVDTEDGMCQAIRHLLDLGHRDIAFPIGSYGVRMGVGRWPAIQRTMHEAGIPLRQEWILHEVPCTAENSDAFTRRVMRPPGAASRPTAIIYANDELAMSGMHVLREMGFEIPRDVSVMGYDDLPVAKLINPAHSIRTERKQ